MLFYEDIKGYSPVEEFLNSLDVKMRYKMVSYIELLEDYGPDSDHLTVNTWKMEYLN